MTEFEIKPILELHVLTDAKMVTAGKKQSIDHLARLYFCSTSVHTKLIFSNLERTVMEIGFVREALATRPDIIAIEGDNFSMPRFCLMCQINFSRNGVAIPLVLKLNEYSNYVVLGPTGKKLYE